MTRVEMVHYRPLGYLEVSILAEDCSLCVSEEQNWSDFYSFDPKRCSKFEVRLVPGLKLLEVHSVKVDHEAGQSVADMLNLHVNWRSFGGSVLQN